MSYMTAIPTLLLKTQRKLVGAQAIGGFENN